jgi:hypothetical protein
MCNKTVLIVLAGYLHAVFDVRGSDTSCVTASNSGWGLLLAPAHLVPHRADHDNLTGSIPRAPGRPFDALHMGGVTPRALRATRRARLEQCWLWLDMAVEGIDIGDVNDG